MLYTKAPSRYIYSQELSKRSVVDYLLIDIGIVVFWVLEEIFLPLARYNHHGLMSSPAYLVFTSNVSLSLLDTNRVPNHYRLESSRITKP